MARRNQQSIHIDPAVVNAAIERAVAKSEKEVTAALKDFDLAEQVRETIDRVISICTSASLGLEDRFGEFRIATFNGRRLSDSPLGRELQGAIDNAAHRYFKEKLEGELPQLPDGWVAGLKKQYLEHVKYAIEHMVEAHAKRDAEALLEAALQEKLSVVPKRKPTAEEILWVQEALAEEARQQFP